MTGITTLTFLSPQHQSHLVRRLEAHGFVQRSSFIARVQENRPEPFRAAPIHDEFHKFPGNALPAIEGIRVHIYDQGALRSGIQRTRVIVEDNDSRSGNDLSRGGLHEPGMISSACKPLRKEGTGRDHSRGEVLIIFPAHVKKHVAAMMHDCFQVRGGLATNRVLLPVKGLRRFHSIEPHVMSVDSGKSSCRQVSDVSVLKHLF
jgi:hypothetical protein